MHPIGHVTFACHDQADYDAGLEVAEASPYTVVSADPETFQIIVDLGA